MSVIAEVLHLNIAFNRRTVVHDVCFTLQDTGITVLIGRSGSGKTTLLRAFNRLNEEFPDCRTTGTLKLDLGKEGHRLEDIYASTAPPLTFLRRQVGMVFQTPQILPISLFRNVALPLEIVGACPKKHLRERVQQALMDVGLWDEVHDRLHTQAQQFSGGQQQRLCLARALALQPRLLLLDEPTASLDAHATNEVEVLLQRLARHYPLLMVSHSLAQARRLAQHFLIMEQGSITHKLAAHDCSSEQELAALMHSPAL